MRRRPPRSTLTDSLFPSPTVFRSGEEDHAGARFHLGHDAVEMRFRTNHRPEMPHHLDIVELGDRRLGDILERLAGGIGYEVEVEAAHRGTMASARGKRQAETSRPPLWSRTATRGWTNRAATFPPPP